MGIAIAVQAFGHHSLQAILDAKQLSIFETASRYLMWGSIWVMVMGIGTRLFQISKLGLWLIFLGLGVFCGSLFGYLLVPCPYLMIATPVGGAMMIVGFLACAYSGLKQGAKQ